MPRRPAPTPPRIHFENPAGLVVEHPGDRGDGFVAVAHAPGPRRFSEVQTLLGHAKQLLARRGWRKLLGDQRRMAPFTPDEQYWVTTLWLNVAQPHGGPLYGAVVLAADAYASLGAAEAASPGQAAAMTYRLFDDVAPAQAWLEQLG